MDAGKPDISQIDINELKAGFFSCPDEMAFRISITEAAYRSIHGHAEEDTSIEICGILVGEVLKDEKGPFLVISAAIRGENATTQAGQVTFTQEAWSHIIEIKDAKYHELSIVGWYHSHPEFGIFLSPQDQFVQTTLFNQPWQVAFVVDPISGDEGFFVWHKGTLVRASRFWLDGISRSKAEHTDPSKMVIKKMDELLAAIPISGRNKFQPLYFFASLLLFGLLCLAVYLSTQSANERMLAFVDKAVYAAPKTTAVSDTSEEGRLKDEILGRLMQSSLLAPLKIQVIQKNKQIWCAGEVYTWGQKDLVGQIVKGVPGVESVDLQGISVTHIYKVLEGDTLEKVAFSVYGDGQKWWAIYRANLDIIKDPGKILPSLSLRLPE